jgi:hypothetical protein
MEEAERGVVGEERDFEEEVEYPSSAREEFVVVSPEESVGELLSTARTGRGFETAGLKRSGTGRALVRGVAGGGELRSERGGETRSAGGGVILTLGEERVLRLLLIPLRTELLLPPRLQERAESDLEGVVLGVTVPVVELVVVVVVEGRLPRAVPPLMTVVPPGVWGREGMSSSNLVILAGVVREANFPPIAAVMGNWSLVVLVRPS